MNVFLSSQYPVEFSAGNRKRVFSSMAFAGTVVGQLTFGYIVDRTGRKAGMLLATAIVFVFTALSAGAYYHGNIVQVNTTEKSADVNIRADVPDPLGLALLPGHWHRRMFNVRL